MWNHNGSEETCHRAPRSPAHYSLIDYFRRSRAPSALVGWQGAVRDGDQSIVVREKQRWNVAGALWRTRRCYRVDRLARQPTTSASLAEPAAMVCVAGCELRAMDPATRPRAVLVGAGHPSPAASRPMRASDLHPEPSRRAGIRSRGQGGSRQDFADQKLSAPLHTRTSGPERTESQPGHASPEREPYCL